METYNDLLPTPMYWLFNPINYQKQSIDPNSYYLNTSFTNPNESLLRGKGIINIMDDPGCTEEVLVFIVESLKHWLKPKDNPKTPSKPSTTCAIAGALGLIVVLILFGLLAVYAGKILDVIKWIFSFIVGGITGGGRFTSNFIQKIGTDIIESEGTFATLINYVWNMFSDTVELILTYTNVNRYLFFLNVITLFLVMAFYVINDVLYIKKQYEGSIMQKVYNFLDWPFKFILDYIEYLDDGKGFFYYVTKFFVLPFEAGVLALSFVVSGILYILLQILTILKEKLQQNPLPPLPPIKK